MYVIYLACGHTAGDNKEPLAVMECPMCKKGVMVSYFRPSGNGKVAKAKAAKAKPVMVRTSVIDLYYTRLEQDADHD